VRKSIALIGFGKWGKTLYKSIKKICKIKYILKSKDNLNKVLKNIQWAVVATPDRTHYKILKKLIDAKINIFCEKPLALNHKSARRLIDLAKKSKIKIYVSDIENFKNKKIKLTDKNYIYRSKEKKVKNYDFLRKLFYHDIYLLYPKLKVENIKKINYFKSLYTAQILILSKYKTFFFTYELGKKKSHKINNISLKSKKNYINIMMKKVFQLKVNFKANQLSAINTIKILEKTENGRLYTKLF
jgi:hypothetical protein